MKKYKINLIQGGYASFRRGNLINFLSGIGFAVSAMNRHERFLVAFAGRDHFLIESNSSNLVGAVRSYVSNYGLTVEEIDLEKNLSPTSPNWENSVEAKLTEKSDSEKESFHDSEKQSEWEQTHCPYCNELNH
jgi:hypothetical protein